MSKPISITDFDPTKITVGKPHFSNDTVGIPLLYQDSNLYFTTPPVSMPMGSKIEPAQTDLSDDDESVTFFDDEPVGKFTLEHQGISHIFSGCTRQVAAKQAFRELLKTHTNQSEEINFSIYENTPESDQSRHVYNYVGKRVKITNMCSASLFGSVIHNDNATASRFSWSPLETHAYREIIREKNDIHNTKEDEIIIDI